MKLYKQYMSFILKNAFRFPKQAFKVIPSLAMLLIGLVVSVYQILTVTPDASKVGDVSGLFPVFNILLLAGGLSLYTFLGKTAIVGARASDANFLMPAPITPFQLHNFVDLKNIMGVVGLLIFYIPFNGFSVLPFLANPWTIYFIYASVLLMMYSFSYINYISKTSTHIIGRFLKWFVVAIYVAYIALFIMSMTNYGSLEAVLSLPYIEYYPVLGWTMSLMKAFMLLDFMKIGLFTILLVGTIIATYYWAKSQTYNYYEEELTFVQKTEAQFKRAYSGKGIELKTKFVKSKREFKLRGEKALLDMAWIRAGKNWWVKPSLWIKLVLTNVVVYFLFKTIFDSKDYGVPTLDLAGFKLILIIYGGVLTYMRFFKSGTKVDLEASKVYISLLPVKPIYKLFYLQVVDVVLAFISAIGFTITMSVIMHMLFNGVSPLYSIYIFIATLGIEIFDVVRIKVFNALTISVYLGNLLRQIVDIAILLGTTYVMALPLLYLKGVISILLPFGIMVAFIVLMVIVSLKLYTVTEKGKSEE